MCIAEGSSQMAQRVAITPASRSTIPGAVSAASRAQASSARDRASSAGLDDSVRARLMANSVGPSPGIASAIGATCSRWRSRLMSISRMRESNGWLIGWLIGGSSTSLAAHATLALTDVANGSRQPSASLSRAAAGTPSSCTSGLQASHQPYAGTCSWLEGEPRTCMRGPPRTEGGRGSVARKHSTRTGIALCSAPHWIRCWCVLAHSERLESARAASLATAEAASPPSAVAVDATLQCACSMRDSRLATAPSPLTTLRRASAPEARLPMAAAASSSRAAAACELSSPVKPCGSASAAAPARASRPPDSTMVPLCVGW